MKSISDLASRGAHEQLVKWAMDSGFNPLVEEARWETPKA